MIKLRYRALLLVSLSLVTLGVWSMGLFDFMKVCLFSEVNGVVTLEGKPVAGAMVIRTARFNSDIYSDSVITDGEGRYHFDAIYTKSLKKITSMAPLVPQELTITHAGSEYLGWVMNKTNYDMNGEIGRSMSLVCELTAGTTLKKLPDGKSIDGICIVE